MKRIVLPIAMLLLSLVASACVQVSQQIHVIERQPTVDIIDLGEEGDTVGDMLLFANEIFDQNNKNKVGTDEGHCVRTVVGAIWQCFWTISLAEGQLTVQGPFDDSIEGPKGGVNVLAVTGGMGAYKGASGEVHLEVRGADGTVFDHFYNISLPALPASTATSGR